MGATSVTGVGMGSVEGTNQGSKHWTVGVGRLVGPRVMAAGVADMVEGGAEVVLPLLSGEASDYIVLANSVGSADAIGTELAFNDSDTTLTLAGSGENDVAWAIIKIGLTT